MHFEKQTESILRIKSAGGYLLTRTFNFSTEQTSNTDQQVIDQFINSEFHLWRGEEEPNGLEISFTEEGRTWKESSVKVFGPFNNELINSSHYAPVTFNEIRAILFNSFSEEADYDPTFIDKAKTEIEQLFNTRNQGFFLTATRDKNPELISRFDVFDFFFSFILLNSGTNTLTHIEFGLD
ncbi:hypothetical protein [Ekhidna sp.]|uniref:hypothetical protein n=1 Tax=Ekhidna sp. TaxID=2608089 RepID=UPI003B5C533C